MTLFLKCETSIALLLATGDKTLVEASPLDKIWGIGLAVEDPRSRHPDQWLGLNLLGKVLMRVRDHIRKEEEEEAKCN